MAEGTVEIRLTVGGYVTLHPGGSRAEEDASIIEDTSRIRLGPGDRISFEWLFHDWDDIDDEKVMQAVEELAPSRRVRKFDLGGIAHIGDHAVAAMKNLRGLEELSLRALEKCTNDGLAVLAEMPWLEVLNLDGTAGVSDKTLEVVATMPNLRDLILDSCPAVTDAGMVHLAKMSRLENLSLNGSRLTDTGIAHVGRIKTLASLFLSVNSPITDRSLKVFEAMPNLTSLTLPRTRGWKKWILGGSWLTQRGLDAFYEARPDCDTWVSDTFNW